MHERLDKTLRDESIEPVWLFIFM